MIWSLVTVPLFLQGQDARGWLTVKGVWPGLVRGPVSRISVVGNRAYATIAEFRAEPEMVIFDVTNPADVFRLGRYAVRASDVVVLGDHAYLPSSRWNGADYVGGLDILEVGDAAHPFRRGRYELPAGGWIERVEVSGDHAFVLRWKDNEDLGALEILNITNRSGPVRVGQHHLMGYPTAVQVIGNRAYVGEVSTEAFGGLEIFDIGNPTQPVRLGGFNLSEVGGVSAMNVYGGHAYVGSSTGLVVVNVGDPANPVRVAGVADVTPFSMATSGPHLYVAGEFLFGDWFRGLGIFDIRDPENPVLDGMIVTGGDALDVAVFGDHAYLADGIGGVRVFDVSDPRLPRELGTEAEYKGVIASFHPTGDFTYLSQGGPGADFEVFGANHLRILDTSNPGHPHLVGHYEASNHIGGIHIIGDYAYLSEAHWPGSNSSSFFLEIVKISNPSQPVPVATYPGLRFDHLQVVGLLAYLIGPDLAVVLDVGDPAAPVSLGAISTGAGDMRVVGHHAFLADGTNDLRVLDLSNFASPFTVGVYNTNYPTAVVPGGPIIQGGSRTVELVGGYVYAAGDEGFHAYNVGDPSRVVSVADAFSPFTTCGFHASGPYAGYSLVLPGSANGGGLPGALQILKVSNPNNLESIASYHFLEHICDFRLARNCVYLTSSSPGLLILEVIEAPSITSISRHGSDMELTWNGAPGLRLQRTTSLSAPEWTDVPGSEGQSGIQVPITGGGGFFRLLVP